MKPKPLYAELEQRIKQLEAETVRLKQAEKTLESQNRILNTLLDNLHVGIFMVEAPTGKPILANKFAIDLLGPGILNNVDADTLAAVYNAYQAGADLHYPDDQMSIARGLRGESLYVDDIVVRRPDGTQVFLEVFGTPVRDNRNAVVARLVSFRDITRQKKAEESLKEAYDILRMSPAVAFLWKNREGWPVEFVTDNVKNLLGYTVREFVSGDILYSRIVHPDDLDRIRREVLFYSQDPKRNSFIHAPYRIRTKQGKEKWIEDRTYIRRDRQGRITHYQGIVEDITEKKKAEETLRQSEEKFRTFVEKSPLAISLIGKNGRYVYINPQFTDMFGYTLCDVPAGRDWFKKAFPDPSNRDQVRSTWIKDHRQMKAGQIRPRVFTVTCKDGSRKEVYFRPVTMENGDQFVIYEDITAKIQWEQMLQQAQKFEAIGTLAGGVAHDFNNLLMGIQGRASLMSVDLDPFHPHSEHIHAIEEYIRSAADLTKQLLGFARGGKYEVKPLDMNELVFNSVTMFGRTKKEINIHTKFQNTKLVVEADRRQIEQVLLNIYVNAWQAMPGGGDLYLETRLVTLEKPDAGLRQVRTGRYVKVTATDTGIGMDEATCKQIFDPFFTTKPKGRGTGLGLASAFGIIKNHEGLITVYSEVGHGTTFNIYLPASDQKVYPDACAQEKLMQGVERILLVDDEQMIIEVGKAMLEKLGYQVVVARGGWEAIRAITRTGREIDLVILDLIMPGMDGGKTFDRIREIQPALPVLLSSGYAINGQANDILRRGCNGFIQKPFNLFDLSKKIREILDDWQTGNAD